MVFNKRKQGIIEVILSGICFGFLGYFGKVAYSYKIEPLEFLSIRYLLGALILWVFLLLRKKQEYVMSLKDAGVSLLLGVFGYALFSGLFFYSLTGLSATLAVLLLYTYPVIVTLISWRFLKESISGFQWAALGFVTIGLLLLVTGELKVEGVHYLMAGLAAAFFYALYIIYSRFFLNRVSALGSSFYVQLGAGVILTILSFKDSTRPLELISQHFLFIFSMAFICSFLAMTLFLSGLQKLTSSETSILSTTEPISGMIIAYFLLGERLTAQQLLGGLLILIGLFLVNRNKQK